MPNILITGARGQIGSELTPLFVQEYGKEHVFTLDLVHDDDPQHVTADVTDFAVLEATVRDHEINEIYHLAAILSANGEKNPDLAWHVNLDGLKNVLDCAKTYGCKVFWPSSIAAFGPNTPKVAPQHTIMEPTTMYGVTKKSGEDLCHYYFNKYGVDVRSVRFPGILSYKTPPGGGTSDYAVAIFYEGIKTGKYVSFVDGRTVIPLMYIDDALKSIVDIMKADAAQIKIRTSYNIAALSFTLDELIEEIQKQLPLEVEFRADFRQQIADSWPDQLDDQEAKADWNWRPNFDVSRTVVAMITGVQSINI